MSVRLVVVTRADEVVAEGAEDDVELPGVRVEMLVVAEVEEELVDGIEVLEVVAVGTGNGVVEVVVV